MKQEDFFFLFKENFLRKTDDYIFKLNLKKEDITTVAIYKSSQI